MRFVMKLPRLKNDQFTSSTAAGALRGQQEQNEVMRTTMTTPRASNGDGVSSGNNHMRRSQSARGSRLRSITTNNNDTRMHKSRSHSQEPISSLQQRPARTQELPIPGGHDNHRASLSRTVDKNDLTKMYDYATWNMYERIVGARRQREQQPSPSKSQSGEMDSSSNDAGSKGSSSTVATRPLAIDTSKQPLSKASSQDESSTAATADETDKSSTASSSWSRADSPMTFPGGSGTFLTNLEPQRAACSSCPPTATIGADEDHFIFQLDM
eukprot:CAMPEP_0172319342 /NCGR_PEP_ID=MMETSP1058-20130122/37379_1 /TAXON_ID=83371 /ORGANISM="Detonula confervacea, Strain CCMP 353" /LENGTH=268 /DNA_ID=CAMNT_0013034359 /DNA_START=233 /DNA_END=1039 /DNA_ORIENTATION=+